MHFFNFRNFIYLLFFSSAYICTGQSYAVFKKIDQLKGLSNGRITSIIKEKKGFVWIGTDNGLNRYDGSQIKIFNKQNSSISSNNISDVLLDNKGRIWIATLGGGLNLYKPSENTFLVYKNNPDNSNSLPSNQLNTLFEDSKGNLWIGTEKGLCLFDETTQMFQSFSYRDKKNQNPKNYGGITSICEDSKGTLWVGTFGGGLSKFLIAEKYFQPIKSDIIISADFIHTIKQLNKNTLLIGTSGSGLLELDINTLEYSNYFKKTLKREQNFTIVRTLHKDSQGSVWIGTDGNGIVKIETPNNPDTEIYNYRKNPQLLSSLSGDAVYEITEDNSGNIWIGTAWNGVNILNPKSNYAFLFSDIKGENTAPVLSVYKNEESLFLGSDGKGLTVFNSKLNSIQQFNKDLNTSLGGDYIQCITESKNGTFWLGTFANGLINFNIKTRNFTQYKHRANDINSLSFNDVRCIIEDEFNNLWIASWGGGLNYFNTKTKKFTSYRENKNNDNSISNDNVISLQREGNLLWLGTFGGGLNLFDINTKKFTHFQFDENNLKSIGSNNILSLLLDSKGKLWIGSSGGGINLFDKDTREFNRFETEKGIQHQTITAIIEDNNGFIWFSTKQGIYKYDYTTKTFTNFLSLAGEYHMNAVCKDEKGLLYFGSSEGILRFNPVTLVHKNIHPNVKITNFKLFNKKLLIGENEILTKSISYTDKVTLKHNLNVITFDFAALQFPFSSECEYAIQMDEFDKDWRSIGKNRTATYTNLSSGLYTFKVKSREAGSNWGEEFTSVNIEVLKPFWLEWWAYIFYVCFVIFIFYIFRKYIIAWEQMKTNLRLEKITHEKDIEFYNLKQQFFINISHEIRTPVTLILSSINNLLKSDKLIGNTLSNPIKTLKKNGNHLLHLIDELLDFRKLEHNEIKLKVSRGDWVKFCEEIYLSFSEIALQKDIKFDFETSKPELKIWFDNNQMEKVLYNLLSNAFKFSDKRGLVKLSISDTETHVQLKLIDKGTGIPKKQLSKIFNRFYQTKTSDNFKEVGFGLGLSISKQIIELHHGEIFVESKKDVGSTFTIRLKKGFTHFEESEKTGSEADSELIENYFIDKPIITDKSTIDSDLDNPILKEQTLLVVEDNSDIRAYIVEILSDEFTILQASDGKEGMEIAIEKLPDLIVSDVIMPIMDGIELTRTLKTNVQTSHIPIILLTAVTSFIHKKEGFDTGADDYITKPFNELLLRSRIKNVLNNRKLLHSKFSSEDIVPIDKSLINSRDRQFLENLITIIEDNIGSDSTLNTNFIIKNLGMSHSVVYKKLKALTGLNLVNFITNHKLKKAKQLLKEQKFTVTEVCYQIGYSDRKYFSKCFKKRFGKNPSYYLGRK